MADVDLTTTRQVIKLHNVDSVNEYLSLGWILLETVKQCYDPIAFPDHQSLDYILIWNKETSPIEPKSYY